MENLTFLTGDIHMLVHANQRKQQIYALLRKLFKNWYWFFSS